MKTTENTEGTEGIKDGGPAFPQIGRMFPVSGMSLRDWFAGMALQGIIAGSAHPIFSDDGKNEGLVPESVQSGLMFGPGDRSGGEPTDQIWAWVAYAAADAMLVQREYKEEQE